MDLDSRGVDGKIAALGEHLLQRRDDLIGRSVVGSEDAREVFFCRKEERRLVRVAHAHQLGERVEALAVADRHITCKLFLVTVNEHGGLPVRLDDPVLGAARGAGTDTEGLGTNGIGSATKYLRRNTTLTVEQFASPAARADIIFSRSH